MSVLLVDDRPENLLALRAVLEPLGCPMTAVTSGEEALKALLQQEFAVVLLDVQMPGMDGFETADMIKARERTRTVPIIFVTAISKEKRHVYRGYEAGAVDYVFKPYEPELLRSKVRVFLELDAKSRAAARSEALLRAAFASAPIGMARLDLEGRVAEANDALGELVARRPADLRDTLFDTLVHAEDRRELAGAGAHEARLLTADGEAIPCALTYSLAEPGGGLPPSLVVQVQDLRERLRAEVEREQRIREQIARSEAERASAMLRSLQAVSDVAISTLPFDQLVADLLDRVADALGADTASAVLAGDDGSQVVHQMARTASEDGARRWYSVVASSGDQVQQGEFSSTLAAPLAAGGEVLGELRVSSLFERRFDSDDADMLRLAAERAALAIQRARVHQRDRAITEELQRSLLPAALPQVGGTATAARYLPGGDGERVGGDWYDAVLQPDGRLLLAIGDVAGHGIGAASEMGQLRSALRAYALDGHGPAELLERMNAFHVGMPGPGMTTVALVSVDLTEAQLTYACAGHLPPLIVGARGAARWLDGALGPPLGALDAVRYPEKQVRLGAGARVVLYTDGLVEQRGELLDDGLERLRAAVGRAAPMDVEAFCDHVLGQTARGAGAIEDDVTLLVLRVFGDRRRTAERRKADGDAGSRRLSNGTWPYPVLRSARVELPMTLRAGGAARRILRETLSGLVEGGELEDLHAIASEVVNNAVVHGGRDSLLTLHMAAANEVLRVEVVNDGAAFEPPPPSAKDEPGGFGLGIVEQLSSRWGLDFEQGVCVWFEVDRTV